MAADTFALSLAAFAAKAKAAPGQVAAVRFAVEGIRDGQPVITM